VPFAPRQVIRNISEDITTRYIEGTLVNHNPDLSLKAGASLKNIFLKLKNIRGTWLLRSTPRSGSSSCKIKTNLAG